MPKDYYDREDYSDDEYGYRSRSKFRRERSPDKDDFGRDKRRRKKSASPEDRERRPRRNRSSSRDGGDPGDHYIPNYDRDGYNPAPRYSRGDSYGGRYGGAGEYGGYDREYRGSSRHRDDGYMDMDNGDMPGGWGGPGGERIEDPMKLDYLISFKQFCEHLRGLDRASHRYRRYTDEDLQSRYATYREDFIAKQRFNFFDAHKDDAWFQEKYHPEHSKARKAEIIALRRKLYEQFVIDLANGKYDSTTCDEDMAKTDANSKGAGSGAKEDEDREEDENGELPKSDSPMLYLRAVLPSVSKKSLLETCQKVHGFRSLSLSEPHPLKDLQRIGWIKLEQGTDPEEALKVMTETPTDDYQVTTTPHRPTRARYTHEIASSDVRIQADRELVVLVAKACDRDLNEAIAAAGQENIDGEDSSAPNYDGVTLVENRLQSHILPALESNMDESEQEEGAIKSGNERQVLDLYIEYLRQVHMFCYYCGGESDNLEEFARKCVKHYRKPEPRGGSNASKGATWVKNLEQKLNIKINPPSDEEIEKLGGKSLEKNILKFLQQKTQQQEPAKWRCKICTKPFRGEEFVHKHIRTKHPDDVKEVEESILLFNNYVLDPYHINPATQHQQQMNPVAMHHSVPPGHPTAAAAMMTGGPMPLHFGAGGPPMPMPFMGPAGVSSMFPHGFVPPSFSATAALAGTPMDQIPRIGFDIPKRSSKEDGGDSRRGGKGGDAAGGSSRPALQLDPRSRMADPRQVKSYVDLDAPAEGDLDAKYNLW